jgi:DNA processing protein
MLDDIKKNSIDDKNFPRLLKEIKSAPKVLYYIGELRYEENCIAMVGTRRYSSYGKQIALEMAADLAEAGLTVVSGLAPGIDTFCHEAVVTRKKRTIAVLGTGLDRKSIYPQSNLKLAEKIVLNGGCLVSEYPPETRGTNFTFPQRNRIVSGLSLGVVIVEAKEKSGSLITAQCAKSQGRKIFAVPGQIYSSNSKGSHKLIKEGAKLVENANDILSELNSIPELKLRAQNNVVSGENEEENLILNILKENSLYIDKIIEETKLPAPVVARTLAILEIRCKIRNLGSNIFALMR